MRLLLLGIGIGLLFFSCSERNISNNISDAKDTINIDVSYQNKKPECPDFKDKYYSKFGVTISNYYQINDSLPIDLNRDGLIDTLLLLSPILLDRYYDCAFNMEPTRVLVEIINYKGKSKVRNKYSNIVSSIGGVLSKYDGMNLTKEGFEINHYSGSKYTWRYTIEFSTKYLDSLFLNKTRTVCGLNSNTKIVEYSFNKYPIEKINIKDTLKNNCNCDAVWNELEGQE